MEAPESEEKAAEDSAEVPEEEGKENCCLHTAGRVFALPVLKLLSNVKVKTASEGNERSEPGMKRRVSDIAVMILSFLVLLALSAGAALVGVEAVRGEQWQRIRLTAGRQGSGVWGGIACVAVAVLALVLARMCLWRVFPHRTASQRGYVMQKNENGTIGVSIRAIEGLIRTCIDKHEAIAKADITVEECRDEAVRLGDCPIAEGAVLAALAAASVAGLDEVVRRAESSRHMEKIVRP